MQNNLFAHKKYWLAFLAWFIAWPIAHFSLLVNFGVDYNMALLDSIISNSLLAFVCFDITFILRYYHLEKKGWHMPLIWTAGLAGIWLLALTFIFKYFDKQHVYFNFFRYTMPVRYVIGFIIIGAFVILDRLMYYMNAQREDSQRKMDLEKLSKDAELSMLRQQLQPHFLFNTLNSVSALITNKPEEARRMIQQLSDFLRGTVKKDDQQFVDLSSELKQLELYLNIEKVRFGHRLDTVIEHDDDSTAMKLPPLLLQPLVENAIKFGLYDTTDAVTIRIKAKAANKQLVIGIENPYDTQTAKPRQGTGFGLSSVQRRLYLLFGRNDLLQTDTSAINGETTFTVTVKIPQYT